jgi:lipoprotein-releasing system permease protein
MADLQGIEPEEFARIVPLPDKITAGTWRLGTTDVLIGIELGRNLGAAIGDKVRIATPSGASLTLTVTGLFDLGSRGANERTAYVPIRTAQDLLALPGGASNLYVTVEEIFAAEEIAQRITATVGLEADSWIRTNNQFFIALTAQTISNSVIRLAVGISVALGIASVLVVSVVQKSHEIGILRAMGASRRQVMNVFLIQGGVVGLAGSLIGSALAAAFLFLWRGFFRNPDGTPLFMLEFDPALIAWAAVVATLTGLAAAVTPARRAARLNPVEAIRG